MLDMCSGPLLLVGYSPLLSLSVLFFVFFVSPALLFSPHFSLSHLNGALVAIFLFPRYPLLRRNWSLLLTVQGNFANCRIERLPSRLWREWADYLPKDLMRALVSQADPGRDEDDPLGRHGAAGSSGTPAPTPASVPGASPSAGAGGLAALLAGDSDDESSKRKLDLDFMGP